MATYPTYAPEFSIKINGDRIPAALRGCITQITYQDGIEGADRVEVTVANENLRWLDHPLLHTDNGFSLSIGYAPDPLEEVFVGEITGVNASFPNGGMPTLTVVAHDFLQRLTHGTKDREFALSLPCIGKFPLPDPLVVSLVSATNLVIPAVDPAGAALSFLTLLIAYAVDPIEAKKGVRVQKSQSDFDFLSGIAKENGWEMYIDHTIEPKGYVLKFQFLIQDYSPSVNLKWGQSLIDFTPKISTVGQVGGVSARIWVASIQMEFMIVLSWDFDRAAFNLMVFPNMPGLEDVPGISQTEGVLKIQAISPVTAPKQILSELLPRLNNRLTASGTTIGNPRIKASRVVNFDGVGEQFGGLYRITSATHSFDGSGYRTQFEARKEVWFGSVPIPKGPSGLLRVQGQTIN